uniref:Retrovirus-related Pol polyprotein from transposon TNT 1-94 n=1 Tax=Tanacetum cinerariifolium TaxID=118510 RepID=A0A6L2N881_TANCI|nr:retrovirus-related Pol polyprotein from transposon TNT 1-94 [Tanacetum cinerariifolium]
MEDMLPLGEEQMVAELLVKELLKLMCDRKNNVLLTNTECLVLSYNFKLLDESQILLRVPRKNNILMNKKYGSVVTDDYSRYTWVFFLSTKDETTCILKKFITEIENLVDKKVKVFRCDNETEFKNSVMNVFCAMKGIRREFSVARTSQQNGVAERRNKTLIEASRIMLANSKLPTTFWSEAVNTACYVQNRVLLVKPYNRTPYELFRGRTLTLSFMRPFGCHGTILNTLDHLGKFDRKANKCFFIGYYMNSKAFRVYNTRTRRVEENLHIELLENKPIVAGNGPEWLFDIDMLTKSMNYVPVIFDDAESPPSGDARKKHDEVSNKESGASNELHYAFEKLNTEYQDDLKMPVYQCCISKEMQEELLQFKLQKVWILVDLPKGKKAIGTKWVFKNKKDERGIVIKNKASLCFIYGIYGVSDGCEESFLYERIEEEVYVCQPLRFKDHDHPDKVYKVVKALYGLHQALRACTRSKLWLPLLQLKLNMWLLLVAVEKYFGFRIKYWIMVDGKEFTVTEASVRRHLQLADADGISVLTNTKIFDQLLLMGMLKIQAKEGKGSGHPSEPLPPPSTAQPPNEEPIPNVVSSSHQKTQTPRQALNKVTELPQTSELIPNVANEVVYEEWYDRVETAATTAASLDAEQASGVYTPGSNEERFEQHELTRNVQQQSNDPPLSRGYTLGSGEDSIKLIKKLMETYTKLSERDSSKQGRSMIEEINQDAGVTLVQIDAEDQGKVTPIQVNSQGEAHSQEDQPEDQLGVLSAAKVLADAARKKFAVKDKGKDKMVESEDEQTKRTKLQQEQDRLGHEAAVRLQEELDEEERQRMARVHEASQSFTEEEWENIRARVKADEELTQRLQAEERNKYSKVDQAKMLVDLINQRKRYFAAQKAKANRNKPMTQAQHGTYKSNYIKNIGSYTLNQLKKIFYEIKKLFETTMKRVNTFVPMETEVRGRASELVAGSLQATITNSAEVESSKRAVEAELDYECFKRKNTNEALRSVREQPDKEKNELSQEYLQQMMMVVPVEEVYVESLQVKYPIIGWERYMHDPLIWRLYDTRGVHHVPTEKRMDIFMLVEKEYPLLKGVLTLMLVNKLLVDQHSEMAN